VRRRLAPGLALAALGCLALVAASCGKRPSPKPRPDLDTPYQEEKVGAEASKEAEAQLGVVESPELEAYVAAIGRRLARHAPGYRYEYQFRIANQAEPNAFALPGGFVFLSRGSLLLSNSEDEVANVLGHEIAHVASRHSAAQQQVMAGNPIVQAMQMPYLSAYNRDLERSADRVGQGLAALAGYDPIGLQQFLSSLDALERSRRGASRRASFLDTHPGTQQRSAEAGQRASSIAWREEPPIADPDAYLRMLEGLAVGEPASEGIVRGSRFLHPDLGFTILFPDGWEIQNTPAAVGAMSPERQTLIMLEHGGPFEPEEAAQKWIEEVMEESGLSISGRGPVRMRGRVAHRVTGSAAGLRLDAWFLPFRGQTFRLLGIAAGVQKIASLVESTARTLRPMTPELLATVTEQRVHIAEAEGGETLIELSRRTGNAWPLQVLAVLNGLPLDAPLRSGRLVKVALERPYQPRPVTPASSPER